MERTTLKIDGMSCGHCVAAVRSELEKLDGVKVEAVQVGSATVSFDPNRVGTQQLVDAVGGAGYDADIAA
jgi:copper chaperone CopZ